MPHCPFICQPEAEQPLSSSILGAMTKVATAMEPLSERGTFAHAMGIPIVQAVPRPELTEAEPMPDDQNSAAMVLARRLVRLISGRIRKIDPAPIWA
jgi:hypothetical protein